MKDIEITIANTLLLNAQYIDSVGLAEGKMGPILFLYHFARKHGYPTYNKAADILLDEVIDKVQNEIDTIKFPELCGFAWAMNHLYKEQFLDGDPENVLSELNKLILAKSNEETVIKMNWEPIVSYLKQLDSVCNKKRETIPPNIENQLSPNPNPILEIIHQIYCHFIENKKYDPFCTMDNVKMEEYLNKVLRDPSIEDLYFHKGITGIGFYSLIYNEIEYKQCAKKKVNM